MQPDKLPNAGSSAYWLRFAEGDLVLARNQPSEDLLPELLCFHTQQAVEKAIKAATELTLYASGTRYPGDYEPLDNVDYLEALSKAENELAKSPLLLKKSLLVTKFNKV